MIKSMKLTGKVWQIRAQLRDLAKSKLTVAQFIERNQPIRQHLRLIQSR